MAQAVSLCDPDRLEQDLECGRGPRRFGPCSLLALTCQYPGLLSCTLLRHPCRTGTLLRHADARAVRGLLELVPQHTARDIFRELLRGVDRRGFFDVVAPIINTTAVRAPLALLLQRLEPRHAVEIVNAVPADKLAAALEAPPEALIAVIAAVDPERFREALIPLMQEPTSVISGTFVPLLARISHPDRLGAIVNQAASRVLLWIVRGLEVARLAALLDLFEPVDLAPGGTLMSLLEGAADDPELVDTKVLPLLRRGDPALVVPFLRGASVEQLLALLRRVETDNLVRLLENTNTELAVRLCNGPLEDAVRLCIVADGLGGVMRNPLAAQAVRQGTDALNSFLHDVQASVDRGKEARGVGREGSYRFGDVTRGVLSRIRGGPTAPAGSSEGV
mmetsp:Transcript_122559/g.357896  ORF Transcript_122559/g.357896 Transcript_122559/m.357896 type:complete len:392 (-) Transcript_122559:304-1479(-)